MNLNLLRTSLLGFTTNKPGNRSFLFLNAGGVSGGIRPLETARTNSCLFLLESAVVCIIVCLGVFKYGRAIISESFSVTVSNSF